MSLFARTAFNVTEQSYCRKLSQVPDRCTCVCVCTLMHIMINTYQCISIHINAYHDQRLSMHYQRVSTHINTYQCISTHINAYQCTHAEPCLGGALFILICCIHFREILYNNMFVCYLIYMS